MILNRHEDGLHIDAFLRLLGYLRIKGVNELIARRAFLSGATMSAALKELYGKDDTLIKSMVYHKNPFLQSITKDYNTGKEKL